MVEVLEQCNPKNTPDNTLNKVHCKHLNMINCTHSCTDN